MRVENRTKKEIEKEVEKAAAFKKKNKGKPITSVVIVNEEDSEKQLEGLQLDLRTIGLSAQIVKTIEEISGLESKTKFAIVVISADEEPPLDNQLESFKESHKIIKLQKSQNSTRNSKINF